MTNCTIKQMATLLRALPSRLHQTMGHLIAFFLHGTLGVVLLVSLLWQSPCHAEQEYKPSTQVVYRFDDHRYLELTGYGCEGAIYYVDTKRQIRTPYIEQFGRVFLPPITHADDDGDFIFIPYSDASAFAVSKDHGKTFQDARWVGIREFGPEEIKQITVVHQQAFIETKDGRLFMTSKPFGKRWGLDVIDRNYLPQTTLAEWPNFKNMPRDVPSPTNYHGWTEMHCDPDLQGESVSALKSFLNSFRKKEPDEIQ